MVDRPNDGEPRVTGGYCPAQPLDTHDKLDPHVSTGRDVDASRFVGVYVCDYCRCLFVPGAPREDEVGDE